MVNDPTQCHSGLLSQFIPEFLRFVWSARLWIPQSRRLITVKSKAGNIRTADGSCRQAHEISKAFVLFKIASSPHICGLQIFGISFFVYSTLSWQGSLSWTSSTTSHGKGVCVSPSKMRVRNQHKIPRPSGVIKHGCKIPYENAV